MPAERTYEGIYPQQWTKIKDAAKKYGFKLEMDQGKAEAFGVTITWERRYQVASTAEPSLRIVILKARKYWTQTKPDESLVDNPRCDLLTEGYFFDFSVTRRAASVPLPQ